MRYELETKVFPDKIHQDLHLVDELQNIRETISREIIDLKEQGIKDALISLGWTPPKE